MRKQEAAQAIRRRFAGINQSVPVVHYHLRSVYLLLAAYFLLLAAPAAARAATPAQIDQAITKAVSYLYARELPEKNWEFPSDPPHFYAPGSRNFTGRTALVTYALLAAGEHPTDPRLAGAIEFLERNPTNGTYAVGVRTQVWPYLKQTPPVHEIESHDAQILLSGVGTKGEANGMWYYTPPNNGTYDHSVSQFGILGLWAMEQQGAEIPLGLWQRADETWRKHQLARWILVLLQYRHHRGGTRQHRDHDGRGRGHALYHL